MQPPFQAPFKFPFKLVPSPLLRLLQSPLLSPLSSPLPSPFHTSESTSESTSECHRQRRDAAKLHVCTRTDVVQSNLSFSPSSQLRGHFSVIFDCSVVEMRQWDEAARNERIDFSRLLVVDRALRTSALSPNRKPFVVESFVRVQVY